MISYDGLKIDSFLASAKFIGCIYAPYVPFNCILPRELFLNNKCFAKKYQIRYSESITMYTFIYVGHLKIYIHRYNKSNEYTRCKLFGSIPKPS